MVSWWRDAWGHRGIRSLGVGSFLSLTVTFSLAVVVSVYAYQEGGAALVAYYGVASTLPGTLLTPVLLGLSARGRADTVLRWTMLLRVALVAGAATAALAGASATVVVSLAALAVSLAATYRPTQALLLPWLASTPRELTAANVAAAACENAAALVGPLLAGGLLLWADPVLAMVVGAGLLGLGAAVLLGVSAPRHTVGDDVGSSAGDLARDGLRGARGLLRLAHPAGVVTLAFGQTFVRGALGVLLVLLSIETLGLGESGVGWLTASVGLGGLAGAALAARVARLDRLGRCLAAGVLLWGIGTAALSGATGAVAALVALGVVGIGNAVEDAGVFTLVPRRLGPRDAAAGLGAFELVVAAGVGTGALLAPALADALGVRGALLAIGAVLAALALAYAPALVALDREEPPPSPDVDLLRGLPAFSALPLVVLEELAGALTDGHYTRGTTVVAEGQHGERFEVVRSGGAVVTVRGVERRVLGPGDGFGEIALLRDVPRTATVTATEDLTTGALDRDTFLAALTMTPAGRGRAERDAAAKVSGDPGG